MSRLSEAVPGESRLAVVRRLQLLVLDVDGVLTDGSLHYSAEGEVLKTFHVHDGLGMRAARENGLRLAVISARGSAPLQRRLQDLGVDRALLGVRDKADAFAGLLREEGLEAGSVAYLGDDLIDLPVMRRVAYPMAVANAQPMVRDAAVYITRKAGGQGAVREAIDHLLGIRTGLEAAYRFVLAPPADPA